MCVENNGVHTNCKSSATKTTALLINTIRQIFITSERQSHQTPNNSLKTQITLV